MSTDETWVFAEIFEFEYLRTKLFFPSRFLLR